MKKEWCFYQNVLSDEVCNHILQTISTRNSEEAKIGGGKNSIVSNDIRRSRLWWVRPDDTELGYLFDIIWKYGLQANEEYFNFDITNLDFLQIAEYDESYRGEYKEHHDVKWLNDNDRHRKLSAVIQLSNPNDYVGGGLQLLKTEEVPPTYELSQRGTMVVFPSFILHRANPVTLGKRYSIAVWFEGPKWR